MTLRFHPAAPALCTLYVHDRQGGVRALTPTNAESAHHAKEDLIITLAGEGPTGCRMEPVAAILNATALAGTEAEFRVVAAEDTSTATYRFGLSARYAGGADTKLLAELSANVSGRFIIASARDNRVYTIHPTEAP